MLPRPLRLPHTDFAGKPLKRAKFDFGSVSFYEGVPARATVVVSKKVARRAVDRNRIRRRVFHALHALLPRLDLSVVVYPTSVVLKAPYRAIKASLEEVTVSR